MPDLTWTSETDWTNAQDSSNVTIDGGSFSLAKARVTVDGFEDNDINEYTGDTGDFQTQNNVVINGTYALVGNGGGTSSTLFSESGLNTYPSAGDTYSYYVQISDTQDAVRQYFAVDISNGTNYNVLLNNDGGELGIAKDGNSRLYTSNNLSLTTGEWYEVEVIWGTDGTIDATVYNLDSNGERTSEHESVTATDSDYTSGGIGWQANNVQGGAGASTKQYYDYAGLI